MVFERTPFFHDTPSVTRVAFVASDGSIRAGLLVDTWNERQNLLHHTLVGPDGAVLFVEQRTSSDSYNVFIEDPGKGAQLVVPGPGAGNAESPAGWLFAGAQNSIHIAGNNVQAYLDANDNNRSDSGGIAVTSGDFLTAANLAADPTTHAEQRGGGPESVLLEQRRARRAVSAWLHRSGRQLPGEQLRSGRQRERLGQRRGAGRRRDGQRQLRDAAGRPQPAHADVSVDRHGPVFEVAINSPITASYGAAGAEFGPVPTLAGITGDVVLVNDGVGVDVRRLRRRWSRGERQDRAGRSRHLRFHGEGAECPGGWRDRRDRGEQPGRRRDLSRWAVPKRGSGFQR